LNRRMIAPVIIGLLGVSVLLWLANWQMQRLTWKEAMLAEIEARIQAAPVPLPVQVDPKGDKYLPVKMSGISGPVGVGAPEITVLVSRKDYGAGYRVITPFLTDGRTVLLDRGFIRLEQKTEPRPPVSLTVTGNLHWPDDRNSSTPANDIAAGIWFARDIADMARALGTEPILVIARSETGQGVRAMPVGITGIANNHLNYAITWFLFAVAWLGMTGFWLWRIRQRLD